RICLSLGQKQILRFAQDDIVRHQSLARSLPSRNIRATRASQTPASVRAPSTRRCLMLRTHLVVLGTAAGFVACSEVQQPLKVPAPSLSVSGSGGFQFEPLAASAACT